MGSTKVGADLGGRGSKGDEVHYMKFTDINKIHTVTWGCRSVSELWPHTYKAPVLSPSTAEILPISRLYPND